MADRSPAGRLVRALGLVALGGASLAGCAAAANGAACATDVDCQSSLVCVADPALSGPRCMRPCEEGTRLCADGSVCLAFAGGRACYPGGAVGFEEPCLRSLDCESGTVCPDAVRSCAQACDGISPTCLPTERCLPDDAVGAYCAP